MVFEALQNPLNPKPYAPPGAGCRALAAEVNKFRGLNN